MMAIALITDIVFAFGFASAADTEAKCVLKTVPVQARTLSDATREVTKIIGIDGGGIFVAAPVDGKALVLLCPKSVAPPAEVAALEEFQEQQRRLVEGVK